MVTSPYSSKDSTNKHYVEMKMKFSLEIGDLQTSYVLINYFKHSFAMNRQP